MQGDCYCVNKAVGYDGEGGTGRTWRRGSCVCSNEGQCGEASQAIKIHKRSQGRDADLGMIINNALRNKNQKSV